MTGAVTAAMVTAAQVMGAAAAVASTFAPQIALAGTAMTALGQIKAGQAAAAQGKMQQNIYAAQARDALTIAERNAMTTEDAAKYDAERAREQAGQEQAASQRAFHEKDRQTKLALSSARAEAGASGAGVYDPTMLDIAGNITGTGTYDALTSLYEGDATASLLRSQATQTEYEGARKAESIRYGAASDASLLDYKGKVAVAEGKAAKQESYMNALGTGLDYVATKYAPKSKATK